MIKLFEKHEKIMVVISILIALMVIGGSIGFAHSQSTFNYVIVLIGIVLSAIMRSFTKSIPTK